MKHHTYSVTGLHCASCVSIIEEKLLESGLVSKADASLSLGTVTVAFEAEKPDIEKLNMLFPDGTYLFSDTPIPQKKYQELLKALVLAIVVIAFVGALPFFGISSFDIVTTTTSPAGFLLFGLVAGMSSCAALVSGIVLSLSGRWMSRYNNQASLMQRMEPHFLFNTGRIVAYCVVGGLLGLFGESIHISLFLTSTITVLVSLLMIVIALQMLGITIFNRFSIVFPRPLKMPANFSAQPPGIFQPLLTGLMTVVLPCGFTMVAESAAILSGNGWKGMLIMFCFVLGTTIPLLLIGASSIRFGTKHRTSSLYVKTAGILILFFAFSNLDSSLGAMKLMFVPGNSATRLSGKNGEAKRKNTTIITTIYTTANDVSPSSFNIRKGENIRFVVDSRDNGSGCMSTIMIPGLWDKPERLVKGEKIVMEFTPLHTGTYRITCAMGVPRGVVHVR